MNSEFIKGFLAQAENCLPIIRGGIAVAAATGNVYGELSSSLRQTIAVREAASIVCLDEAAEIAGKLEEKIKNFVALKTPLTGEQSQSMLDELDALENLLAETDFDDEDFLVSNESTERSKWSEEFTIDEETLKIFAEEAEELLTNIGANLEILEKTPGDRQTLLEVRRGAHTLKSAAGIVGLKLLADVAHRFEDLLDYLAENRSAVGEKYFKTLCNAADCCGALAVGENSPYLAKKINRLYEHFDALAAKTGEPESQIAETAQRTEDGVPKVATETTVSRPTVRVALEKLDGLEATANALVGARRDFEQEIRALMEAFGNDADSRNLKNNFESMLEKQRLTTEEMCGKLARLRLIAFGSLAVRLRRTVRVAAVEEGKTAELIIEGEELEIDTQTLDSIVEPLMHLLRNAVAHGIETPDARRTLGKPEAGQITIKVFEENGNFTLSVADDGRGISAAALKEKAVQNGVIVETEAATMGEREAFELIFLAGLTTAEEVTPLSGRGIGMNVVKNAVTRQEGSISVASEDNQGAVFTIRLPIRRAFSDATTNQRTNCKLSVMVVDDSRSVREFVAGAIENAGWTATVARNGLEALKILQNSSASPDVILSDVEMPHADGYELLSTLKNDESLRKIPLVMITSRADEKHRRKAFDLGAAEYLTKPLDAKRLVETIKNVTAKS